MQEIWKDIKGFEGKYQVSNFGKVRSLNFNKTKKTRELKQCKNKKGYMVVNLYTNKKMYNRLVHRIVAEMFIFNKNNEPQVNHINGIKTDNKIENLEWVSNQENVIHAWETGLSKKIYGKVRNNKKVNQYNLKGKYIKTWVSAKEAGRKLKIDSAHITGCCKHKKYNKTAGGYKWEYAI